MALNATSLTTDVPTTCHAALFRGVGQAIDLQSFDIPAPAANEAVVRIECCTICGSDLHSVTGARSVPVPSILGHEAVGNVVAVGDPAPRDGTGRSLGLGDRVTWSVSVSCHICDRCNNGLPQKCRKLVKYGHEEAMGRSALNGGLAEYLLLQPGTPIVSVPDDLPEEVICPVNCATATVAAALRRAGDLSGKRVLVFGAGMLGLTASAMAKTHGAVHVAVCDLDPKRLELAKAFGADLTVLWHDDLDHMQSDLASTGGVSDFDAIFEFSGAAAAVERACELGDIGARIVLAGTVMPSQPVQIDPEQIVRRCLTLSGVHNYAGRDLEAAVHFLSHNHDHFPFAELVSRSFPLAEINDAIAYAIDQRPIRVAIRPHPTH